MNEQELKRAFEDVMVASSPPPPMDASAALDAARHARRRRHMGIAGFVAAAAVVGVAGTAVLVGGRPGGLPGPAAGPGVLTVTSSNPPALTTPPAPTDTATSWPSGQTDRTARSGPRADRSTQVLDALVAQLPAGYEAPDVPKKDTRIPGSIRVVQSQFVDRVNGREVWEYLAVTAVTRTGDGVGELLASVTTAGGKSSADLCTAAYFSRGLKGDCRTVDVAGEQVALFEHGSGSTYPYDQAAAYQYPDGTVVLIGQGGEAFNSGHPVLAELPFSMDELAKAVTDPKFHLD
jgi:hypothetical protein